MPYDEGLAERVRERLADRHDVTEKKMFGGPAFLINGNMACGITNEDLTLRLGAEGAAEALGEPHVRDMDFTGKPLKGFVYVAPEGYAEDDDLEAWVDRAVAFASELPPK